MDAGGTHSTFGFQLLLCRATRMALLAGQALKRTCAHCEHDIQDVPKP